MSNIDRAQSSSENVAVEPFRRKRKWGRWAADEEAPEFPGGTESQEKDDNTTVVMDPGLLGELQRYIQVEEMVVAKLPLYAFYKARSVCKKWNSLPWNRSFLQRFSNTSLPKPYFILFGNGGCHQAMLVRDILLEKWVLKPLPSFGFQQPYTSVAHGLVYTGTFAGCVWGTVFNFHTKVFRQLPPLNLPPDGGSSFSKLAVKNRSSGNSYRVLVVYDREVSSVYDSSIGVWTRKSAPPVPIF